MKAIIRPVIIAVLAVLALRWPEVREYQEHVLAIALALWAFVEALVGASREKERKTVASDQKALMSAGMYTGRIDGRYGPKTSAGVRSAAILVSSLPGASATDSSPGIRKGHPAK